MCIVRDGGSGQIRLFPAARPMWHSTIQDPNSYDSLELSLRQVARTWSTVPLHELPRIVSMIFIPGYGHHRIPVVLIPFLFVP